MIEDSGGVIHWLQAPDGIRVRAAHWPNGERGTVLLLNGRTDFIERFHEPVTEWQDRGYAIWTLDWRGQGASSRLLSDPIPNHVKRFGDYLADLDLLIDTLILPNLGKKPLLLMAHSMGGHLGAHMLARRPALFSRGILCAPMIDFVRGTRLPRSVLALIAHMVCLYPGRAGLFGPGTTPHPEFDRAFEGNALTTCPDRYAAKLAMMRAMPERVVGGATWGWLRACLASAIALNRPSTIRRISMPVLIAIAGADRLVDNRAIRRFAAQLSHGSLLEVPGAQHELLNERDEHRKLVWSAIDRFLDQAEC